MIEEVRARPKCWSPGCPALTMSKWDSRVCWIHAIRYVIRGERLPLSVVPLRELVERTMRCNQHPDIPGKHWTQAHLAEHIGCSRRHIERLMTGKDQAQTLGIRAAEKWADRFKLHPTDIWGDAYWLMVNEVAA